MQISKGCFKILLNKRTLNDLRFSWAPGCLFAFKKIPISGLAYGMIKSIFTDVYLYLLISTSKSLDDHGHLTWNDSEKELGIFLKGIKKFPKFN